MCQKSTCITLFIIWGEMTGARETCPIARLWQNHSQGEGECGWFLHDNILLHGDSWPSQSYESSWGGTDGDRSSVPGPSSMGHVRVSRAGSKGQWEDCLFSGINYLIYLPVFVLLQKRRQDSCPKCCRVWYLKRGSWRYPFISLCHARETLLFFLKLLAF